MAAPKQQFTQNDYEEAMKWRYVFKKKRPKLKIHDFIKSKGSFSKPIENHQINIMLKHLRQKSLAKFYNVNNSCFVGSIINAVFYSIPQLRAFFISQRHSCDNNSNYFCSINSIENMISSIDKKETVDHEVLLNHLEAIMPQYQFARHEDAMAFFVSMIQTIKMEYGQCLVDGSNEAASNPTDAFFGIQRESVQCTKCWKEKLYFIPFTHLILPTKGNKRLTEIFTDYELMELTDNEYNCSHCGTKQVSALKKINNMQYPPFLVIQFGYKLEDIEHQNVTVSYSEKLRLNLKKKTKNNNNENKNNNDDEEDGDEYSLVAVILRDGDSSEWGHFWSYCSNQAIFYECNDDKSFRISRYQAFDVRTPYALIYSKNAYRMPHFQYIQQPHSPKQIPLIPRDCYVVTDFVDDDEASTDSEYFPFEDDQNDKTKKKDKKKEKTKKDKNNKKDSKTKANSKKQSYIKCGAITKQHGIQFIKTIKTISTIRDKKQYIDKTYSLPSLKKLINTLYKNGEHKFELENVKEKNKSFLIIYIIQKFKL